MLEFIAYKKEHAESLCKSAVDPDAMDNWEENARLSEEYGVGCTGLLDGVPVCAFGAVCRTNGSGDVWFIMSRRAGLYKMTVLRGVKKLLNTYFKDCGFKRLRSTSKKGFAESQRLLEFLGFERQRRDMINGKYYFYRRGV